MKCPHPPCLRLPLPGLLPGTICLSPSKPSAPPPGGRSVRGRPSTGPSCDRLRWWRAQGRQMRHNSRVIHSTRYNSPKSAQILVGLTIGSYSLGKYWFTTRRSRLISIRNSKKRIHNPSSTIRVCKVEKVVIKYLVGMT
jgi:hypothetical protein